MCQFRDTLEFTQYGIFLQEQLCKIFRFWRPGSSACNFVFEDETCEGGVLDLLPTRREHGAAPLVVLDRTAFLGVVLVGYRALVGQDAECV